jgi:hypothetical protein
MPIIPALGWQRQDDHEFEISLGYIARLSQKQKLSQAWWLILVIPATWEVEGSLGKKVIETLFQRTS